MSDKKPDLFGLWGIEETAARAIAQASENGTTEAVLKQLGEYAGGTMQTRGEVAIIGIDGIITKSGDMFSFFFGGTSVDQLSSDFNKALEDPAIKAIVFDIDSPGGNVGGINELGNMIFDARGQKPIIAYTTSSMFSAAYWLASAADKIVMDATAEAGSIGVVLSMYRPKDSNLYEFISSVSPLKRVDPATDEGKAEYQKRVDETAAIFIDRVARNRGVTTEKVLSDFGQGGILIGQAAVDAGLADEIGSLEGIISGLQNDINQKRGRLFTMSEKLTRETLEENFKIITAQAPDLVRAIVDKESKEAKATGHAEGVEAGIKQERERVAGILAVENADQKAKLQAITDGVSVDASYKLFFEAEKAAKAEAAAKLTDVPNPVESQGKETAKDGDKGPDFMAAVAEYQKSKPGCTKTEAMKAVIASQPELHAKWLENLNK